jgi:MerR family mercuric resistance operon transcriptional regulator
MTTNFPVNSMKRGELAKKTRCNLETVRFYEKIGLMPEPPRSASGYRAYDASHERRLRFVLRARELGFAIADIRGLLRLVDGGGSTCEDILRIAEHHLRDVRSKISDLQRLERTLAQAVAACSGDRVPDCPVIDALGAMP